MGRPSASPLLEAAVRRLVHALHRAYPGIETEGVRPPAPGLFMGEIAGQNVRLVPGKRNSRLFLIEERQRGNKTYFRYGFNLFKKAVGMRWDFEEDEARLVLWLTNAATELEKMASE